MFSELVSRLLFDYENINNQEFDDCISRLTPKLNRWIASIHPDNRIRLKFLRATNVCVGDGAVVNRGIIISDDYKPLLRIGRRVAVSPDVKIICSSAPNNSRLANLSGFSERFVKSMPVSIGDDAWIGAGAIVLPGVEIGKFVIVGAGSIVTKTIRDRAIVAGNPAKVIGEVSATCRESMNNMPQEKVLKNE